MENIEVLGFISAFLTTISFVPQAILVIKTRETKALSLTMYSIFTLGVASWLAYGIIKEDSALIFANMVTLLLSTIILSIKIYNTIQSK